MVSATRWKTASCLVQFTYQSLPASLQFLGLFLTKQQTPSSGWPLFLHFNTADSLQIRKSKTSSQLADGTNNSVHLGAVGGLGAIHLNLLRALQFENRQSFPLCSPSTFSWSNKERRRCRIFRYTWTIGLATWTTTHCITFLKLLRHF